jgi:probable HAF family extracellular repeat protein
MVPRRGICAFLLKEVFVTRSVLATTIVLAALVPVLNSAPRGPYYITGVTIADLGTLGGESVARDINDAGTIVGWSGTATGRHAFRHSNGTMSDIGAFFGHNETEANGINNRDEVVGTWWIPGLRHQSWAAYWNVGGGGMLLNHTISQATAQLCRYRSEAWAINDSGVTTGFIGLVEDLLPNDTAFCILDDNAALWSATNVPSLAITHVGPSRAYDINNSSVIVGTDKYLGYEMFRWDQTSGATYPPRPAPVMGTFYGEGVPTGINNYGRIVGDVYHRSAAGVHARRAFLWDGVSANSLDLGVLPGGTTSVAREINDGGFVAGTANKPVQWPIWPRSIVYPNVAFIWHHEFGMVALPMLPGSWPSETCEAHALNNRQAFPHGLIQVVGSCTWNGSRRAVRWNVTTAYDMIRLKP